MSVRSSCPLVQLAVGIAIGLVHRWPAGKLALRVAGAGVSLAGALFLWRTVA